MIPKDYCKIVPEGRLIYSFDEHIWSITTVAFSKDGKSVISASKDNSIRIWDLSTGECKKIFTGHKYGFFSGEDNFNGPECLCPACRGQEIFNGVNSIAISSDNRFIVSGFEDKELGYWNIDDGSFTKFPMEHISSVDGVIITPDGKMVISESIDEKTIRFWDIELRKCLKVLDSEPILFSSISLSNDGKLLASKMIRNIIVRNIPSGDLVQTLECISGTGVIDSVTDEQKYIWDLFSNQDEQRIICKGYLDFINAIAISSDGKRVASGSDGKTIRIWDVESGECINILWGPGRAIYSVKFSPDGTKVFSGTGDGSIWIWDIETGECLKILRGHTWSVVTMALSEDGKLLASGSLDKTVKVWDIGDSTYC